MWSRQIFVAVLCISVVWQQVAAVVNNPSKVEEANKTISENTKENKEKVDDSVAEATEEKGNRREATIADTYGPPVPVPLDSYLPSEPSNSNLPVPVYGVPESPSNNIVYPEPPPDIPPAVSVPSSSYGIPPVANIYGPPQGANYIQPSNSYAPPPNSFNKYGPPLSQSYGAPSNTYGPPKFLGTPRKPIYGPPRFQYGPPGKPIPSNKFGFKPPYKNHLGFGGGKFPSKSHSTYGPPVGYFKDNYNPYKYTSNINTNNFGTHGNSFGYLASNGVNTKYGAPSFDLSGNKGISSQYGVPDLGFHGHGEGNSISSQYGPPSNDILSHPKPQYGPPQPSPHPRPPHPGAPAPPTPPDIKYDGWQPIPGLVSREPTPEYGAPTGGHQYNGGDHSYNKDLSPPPIEAEHIEHQPDTHGSVANLELESTYGPPPQKGLSDSYGAPLNTVTGSGGVISASGEEAHSHRDNHNEHNHINIGLSAAGISGQNIESVKSVGYEIFPKGAPVATGGHVSNTYRAPSANSYALSHSYSNVNFGPPQSYSSFNFHKGPGGKGFASNSEIGLVPPSGVYGAPSGSHGTPLFSKGHSSYLPSKGYGPPHLSNHFGSTSNLGISFQNVNQGSASLGSGYSSYHAPLNVVDGSYNQPHITSLNTDVVGLDYSHPGLTIDLTKSHAQPNSFITAPHDCKSQSLPSLTYGVPSVNSYTASLSSLTTNIGHSGSISSSYGAPESLPIPQAQTGIEPKPHETYGVPDLTVSHSQKVNSEIKANSLEFQENEGKNYGKTVAANFGPNSELVQSESIDFSNIPLQGALGSYTLQIQSADGSQAQVPHGQVLNDGLLQSILAAIEQPKGPSSGQPIIQFQKSLEQQNFVTNDTFSSVVEQLTDDEIRHSTQLAKDDILKTSEVTESENEYPSINNGDIKIAYSSPNSDVHIQYSSSSSSSSSFNAGSPSSSSSSNDQDTQFSSPNQYIIYANDDVKERKNIENNEVNSEGTESPILQNNGIALYFSNNQRLNKETEENTSGEQRDEEISDQKQ